jgi:hypothetical protein
MIPWSLYFVNCFLVYVTKAAVQLYYTFKYCLYTTTIAVHVFYSDIDYYFPACLHIVYYYLSIAKYYTHYFWALNLHIIISWSMFAEVTLPLTMLTSSAFLQWLHVFSYCMVITDWYCPIEVRILLATYYTTSLEFWLHIVTWP